jgi:23S rRNA (uracil1939-C5)-methyltransferase
MQEKQKPYKLKTEKQKLEKQKPENKKLYNSKPENKKSENQKTEKQKSYNLKMEKQTSENQKLYDQKPDRQKPDRQKSDRQKTDRQKPDRSKPQKAILNGQQICPIEKNCGGCQLQNFSYEQQLKIKQKQVDDLLKKYCKVEPIIGMDNPYHYRNKVHAVFDHDSKGKRNS